MSFQESSHITSDAYLQITDYVDGRSLEKLSSAESHLEISQLMMVFAQIGGNALGWLKKQNIIHRNIRPEVVLIKNRTATMSYLTGFSECCEGPSAQGLPGSQDDPWMSAGFEYCAPEMRMGHVYANEVDMYSLCAVMKRMLSLCDLSTTIDADDFASQSKETHKSAWEPVASYKLPATFDDSYLHVLIKRGLHVTPDQRLTPLELQHDFDSVFGNIQVEWPPFKCRVIRLPLHIQCDRRDGNDFIDCKSLNAVLEALWHSRNGIANTTQPAWTYGSRGAVKLRSASKFCRSHSLTDLATCLMDELHVPRDDGCFTILYNIDLEVYYHTPSLMVNVTHLLEAVRTLGMDVSAEVLEGARTQNVIGHPKWKGQYVDLSRARALLREIPGPIQSELFESPLHQSDSPRLQERFSSVDSTRFSILVFDQLHPHMVLLRNCDEAVHFPQLLGEACAWLKPPSDKDFMDSDQCMQYCQTQNLEHSIAMLNYIHSVQSSNTAQFMAVADDEDMTSINTTESFEKEEILQKGELKFRFKKRFKKEGEDAVSDDRLQSWVYDSGGVAEEYTPQRVKSETPEAPSSDIIPTIFTFTKSPERPENATSILGKRAACEL